MQLKPCRYPTCTNLIPRDQVNPFCSEHKQYWHQPRHNAYAKTDYKLYNKFKRDQRANKFYHSRAWKNLSRQLRRKAIWTCAVCGRTKEGASFLVVDHIVPLKVDPKDKLNPNNLWVLCKECHFWKTRLEQKVYGASLISNLDASKRWPKERIANWILSKEKASWR